MTIKSHAISPVGRTVEDFKNAIADNLYYARGQAIYTASTYDIYMALAYTIRDYMMYYWQKNVDAYFEQNPKFVYYLSAEYLLGQQLTQNLLYSDTLDLAREALKDYDVDLDDLIALDQEPGLGNGGLGRLAACFMDSLATLNIPAVGYGIRYEYGIFKQSFVDGWQKESPDDWLYFGNPWEFAQPDDMIEVGFGGHTESYTDDRGIYRVRWIPAQTVMGEPYHTLIPGYDTHTINLLRLWGARASKEFDFQLFNTGDYARAVEQKTASENITKVLYPNDNTTQGKELRLKQQYFFVACSLRDIIKRFHIKNASWEELPNIAVIQLNDSHPVIAIAEFMRILLDEYIVEWDQAWSVATRVFASTQHTLLPEAMEKWPVWLMGNLLPRHLEIIFEINRRFLMEVRRAFPNDEARVRRMSIIEEGDEQLIRMAHLAAVGSFSINGVAELQSDLLKNRVLQDFYALWPEKFNNKTNGVTPRRFMRLANPRLSTLITDTIGAEWLTDLDQLSQLESLIDDASFREEWRAVKQHNKERLSAYVQGRVGVTLNPDAMFDVMVKRLHEYKRQTLKALHIITLYQRIRRDPSRDIAPRVFLFGAKAAPGYFMAKLIIKLINSLAAVINNDPVVRDRLKIVFLPNFNVTSGEIIYPAANLSEQISLAGKEASGTGNMKFALNGAVTIGTLDGANIEIRERVGDDNFFLFGLTTDEVFARKQAGYDPGAVIEQNGMLQEVIEWISCGYFSDGDPNLFKPLVDSLLYHDEYMVLADYDSYIAAQDAADAAYADVDQWTRMSIINTARCGFFSSDRTMRQYNADIWRASILDLAANNKDG